MRAWRVTVAAADEDLATAALWEAGTIGIEVRARPDGGESTFSPTSRTTRHRPLRLLPPGATVEPAEVPEVDWVARFREGFRSFRVGRFVVAPAWDALRAVPRRARRRSRQGLRDRHPRDDPALPRRPRGPRRRRPLGRTLDLGAGTGLLAIAAARLGASPVVASDIDPEATASSSHHARLNGARARRRSRRRRPGLARRASFDLVLANLMALLLVDRSAEIRSAARPRRRARPLGAARGRRPVRPRGLRGLRDAGRAADGEWARPRLRGRPVSAPPASTSRAPPRGSRRAARARGPPRPRGAEAALGRRRPGLRRRRRGVRGRPRRGVPPHRLGPPRARPSSPRPSRPCASCSRCRPSRATGWSSSCRRRPSWASPAIWPVVTFRTDAAARPALHGSRGERWERVASGAAEQCGRAVVPARGADHHSRRPGRPALRRRAGRAARDARSRAAARRSRSTPRRRCCCSWARPAASSRPRPTRCARPASPPASLGPRILRAETAAVAAVAIAQALWGDLRLLTDGRPTRRYGQPGGV